MKNYYDELEVSKTASKEVIEKVYKLLAKKYHPDMNQGDNKHEAEEKFKKISEAYEILSDDNKRKNYDLELEQSNPTIPYEEYVKVINEMNVLKDTLSELKSEINNENNNSYNNNSFNSQSINHEYSSNTNTTNINNNSNTNYSPKSSKNKAKHKYYYTSTGKPASALDYFKYKLKEFFSNIFLLIMSIILAILIIDKFSDQNFINLFINLFK